MSNDTKPAAPANDTEPAHARSKASDTEPGWPPPLSAPPRIEYRATSEDSDTARLLGKLAPARVAPAVGDTRETDGHDAAVARVALHKPPKAHEELPSAAPVVVDASPDPSPAPVIEPLGSAVPKSPAARRQLELSTVANRRRRTMSMTARVAIGLALGACVCAVGVIVIHAFGTAPRGGGPDLASARSATLLLTSAMPSSAQEIPPVVSAQEPEPTVIAPPPAVAPQRRGGTSATSRSLSPGASAAASSPASSSPPAPLPKDIRWTLE